MEAKVTARELVETVRRELAPLEASNRMVELLEAGRVPDEVLAALAGEQYRILASDKRSFAMLAARFPDPPAGDFFLGMAQGEAVALGHLLGFAGALGLGTGDLEAYEPRPGCQAYPAFVAWLALNGTPSDAAVAMVANLAAWGAYCGRTAAALRRHHGLDDQAVAFFDYFASTPPGFEDRALEVAQASLDAGASPASARRAAHLLQAYELSFWNTLAEGVQAP